MAQSERPLPTLKAVQERLATVRGEQHRKELELQCCPKLRRSRRHELEREVAYLSGLAEGLRLSIRAANGQPPPPTDPGKGMFGRQRAFEQGMVEREAYWAGRRSSREDAELSVVEQHPVIVQTVLDGKVIAEAVAKATEDSAALS